MHARSLETSTLEMTEKANCFSEFAILSQKRACIKMADSQSSSRKCLFSPSFRGLKAQDYGCAFITTPELGEINFRVHDTSSSQQNPHKSVLVSKLRTPKAVREIFFSLRQFED